MVASSLEIGEPILATNVYAPTNIPGKIKLCAHLGLWLEILTLSSVPSRLAHLGPSSKILQENIDLLHLFDVKPLNGLFTWNNRRI